MLALPDVPLFFDEGWEATDFGEYRVIVDERALMWTIKEIAAADSLGLDFEATDKDPVTAIPLLLQLARPGRAYVIVLPAFTKTQLAPLMAALVKKPVIGANLSYDYKLLKHHYGYEFLTLYDTQIAEQVGTAGDYDNKKDWLQHVSLKAVAWKHLGIELDKEERETFLSAVPDETWRPTEEQARYAAMDVLILHDLAAAQTRHMEILDLIPSVQLRFRALPAICDMELRGMKVDQDIWRGFLNDIETQLTEVDTTLQRVLSPFEWEYRKTEYKQKLTSKAKWEMERDAHETMVKDTWDEANDGPWGAWKTRMMQAWRENHPNPGTAHYDDSLINLGSPKQVTRAFNALGLKVVNTDKLTRAKLLRRQDLEDQQREVLEVYGERSRLAKLKSAFGEKILGKINPVTGRLSCHINIHLTETGRVSMEKPNLQQIPREATLRHAFVAEPGFCVVTADYSSQELAIGAALSQDPQMVEDINNRRDLYKELAVQVFKLGSVDEVTKEQRQQCKNTMLGISYGLSAGGMESRYFIPKKRAQELLDGVRNRYPVFVAWSDKQVDIARSEAATRTAIGTKRFFKSFPEGEEWKWNTEPRNAPVQGTGGDIMYDLCYRLKKNLKTPAYVGNIVHDEVVGVVPSEGAEEYKDAIVGEMEAAFYDILPFEKYGVKVGIDAHIAVHWTKD